MPDGPLIIQSDRSVMLEVAHPRAPDVRLQLAAFAELEKAPEHIHSYRLTPLGLWNARASGLDPASVIDVLIDGSRYPVPHDVLVWIADTMDRYGRLILEAHPAYGLVLRAADVVVLEEILATPAIARLLGERIDDEIVVISRRERGRLKQALVAAGWPADDQAGYVDGAAHPMALTRTDWEVRDYQRAAAEHFLAAGNGVVVLPCGAGKTIVGVVALAEAGVRTLILVTNTVSARQWRAELLARTTLTEAEIGEYSGQRKEIRPVTIATYQVLVARSGGALAHLDLLDEEDWGLIIYDEVHLLPAPVFRMTADIQSRRRLGLTATLVREDGREEDVFSLIGPKRYDVPWKDLELQGWIAPAICTEVRVVPTDAERMMIATAEPSDRYRLSAIVRSKLEVVTKLVDRHAGEPTLVIGQYLEQLEALAELLGAPLVTGKSSLAERERLFGDFRTGEIDLLVVSKVANFSLDLPDATTAIQVSGTFGSRQEEAQRLGRILRPKADGGSVNFYTIVTHDTPDQDYAARRQRFLAEQGYIYRIHDAADI